MTPQQLYDRREFQYDSKDLTLLVGGMGCYFNHIPELEDHKYGMSFKPDENQRIIIRVYKEFNFDARRFWRLASVWLDGYPIMVIQNAGREGDDHRGRYITDIQRYRQMVPYILSIANLPVQENNKDVVNKDDDIHDLHNFYGDTLDGNFKRHFY